MYIGKSLKYNIVPLHKFCQGTIIEAQVIEIALVEGSKLLFGSVYRSPNSTQENDEMLNTLIRNMSNAGYTYVVIAGDMNYPHINWESMNNRTNEEDKDFRFIEAVRDSYLTQIVDTPTRGRGSTSPSLLDIILTNDPSIRKYQQYAPLGKSDHVVQEFTLNCHSAEAPHIKTVYCYDQGDYNSMRSAQGPVI